MVVRRGITSTFVLAVIAAGISFAGIPVDDSPSVLVESVDPSVSHTDLGDVLCTLMHEDVDLATKNFLLSAAKSASEIPARNRRVLNGGASSLSFCLYTLMGLAACRSGRWLQDSAMGVVPEWYSFEGPLRMGHRTALDPIHLYADYACFVYPIAHEDDIPVQAQLALDEKPAIVDHYRDPIGSRAPPVTSHRTIRSRRL